MRKKCALQVFWDIWPATGLLFLLVFLLSTPALAYNRGMPVPNPASQVEESQEDNQVSAYLKYKPEMEKQAKHLVGKLRGTITDSMVGERILVVSFNKADMKTLIDERWNNRHIIEYVEVKPE